MVNLIAKHFHRIKQKISNGGDIARSYHLPLLPSVEKHKHDGRSKVGVFFEKLWQKRKGKESKKETCTKKKVRSWSGN